ncbi:MAG: hypothetical protein FD180_5026 [Planctomycetota bacterium]|nr:MAG: hypothetical protein FD180_5026 [Planctomycetota bacterium]
MNRAQTIVHAVLMLTGLAGLAGLLASWRGIRAELASVRAEPAVRAAGVVAARPTAGDTSAGTAANAAIAEEPEEEDPLGDLGIEEMTDAQKREAVLRIFREGALNKGDTVHFQRWSLDDFDPDLVWSVAMELWPGLTDPTDRENVLSELLDEDSPHFLEAVELGRTDTEASIRKRAAWDILPYALQSFEGDPEGWRLWSERMKGLSLEEACARSAEDLVGRLRAQGQALLDRDPIFDVFLRPPEETREALARAGYLEALSPLIRAEDADAANAALYSAKMCLMDDEWLRTVVAPLLARPECCSAATYLLDEAEGDWAIDAVMPCLRKADFDSVSAAAAFLGSHPSSTSFPAMIEALRNATNESNAWAIGHNGLAKAAGIPFHRKHDAAWWSAWWEENRSKYEKKAEEGE